MICDLTHRRDKRKASIFLVLLRRRVVTYDPRVGDTLGDSNRNHGRGRGMAEAKPTRARHVSNTRTCTHSGSEHVQWHTAPVCELLSTCCPGTVARAPPASAAGGGCCDASTEQRESLNTHTHLRERESARAQADADPLTLYWQYALTLML